MSASPPKHGSRLRRRADSFLSRSFGIGPGVHAEPGAVRGYHVDMRVKAGAPTIPEAWPREPGAALWVFLAQWALGCFERHVAGEGEEWLEGARAGADLLLEGQRADGALVHRFGFPHTFPLRPPWVSGMAQGEAASLLVRVGAATGDERYADAAVRALGPLEVPSAEGGASALLDGRPFPEEYPTEPPSLVLNGGIFALWGLHDVAAALGEERAHRRFEDGVDALAESIDRWDTGYWSLYDLFPHPVPNVASAAYHALHSIQLRATDMIAPRPELAAAADRFEAYGRSRACRYRALVRKAVFRAAVPRSARLARALPWRRVRL